MDWPSDTARRRRANAVPSTVVNTADITMCVLCMQVARFQPPITPASTHHWPRPSSPSAIRILIPHHVPVNLLTDNETELD